MLQLVLAISLVSRVSLGAILLVGTGSSSDFEVINLARPTDTCALPTDYPHQVSWATSGTLSGRPMLCGGFNAPGNVGLPCHIYGVGANVWFEAGWVNRIWMSGVNLTPETYFMGGGSMSIIYPETFLVEAQGVFKGPDMPEARIGHCFIRINEHLVMLLGGNDGSMPVTTVHIYDFTSDVWTAQASLEQSRSWAFCGPVSDPDTGEVQEIIVAGGSYRKEALNSSEVFHLASGTWRQGPALSHSLHSGASVPFEDSFLLVGGTDGYNPVDSIQTYDREEGEFVPLAATLSRPRQDHVAVLVDKAMSGKAAPMVVADLSSGNLFHMLDARTVKVLAVWKHDSARRLGPGCSSARLTTIWGRGEDDLADRVSATILSIRAMEGLPGFKAYRPDGELVQGGEARQ
eukprot:maker-scaffold435_size171904-snap-gene-0.24 protein:Tk07241 transcript:maker-scaffold435_size171904-snap-gene-0.24-mRNA-1 annotation:"hypothetical protein"